MFKVDSFIKSNFVFISEHPSTFILRNSHIHLKNYLNLFLSWFQKANKETWRDRGRVWEGEGKREGEGEERERRERIIHWMTIYPQSSLRYKIFPSELFPSWIIFSTLSTRVKHHFEFELVFTNFIYSFIL